MACGVPASNDGKRHVIACARQAEVCLAGVRPPDCRRSRMLSVSASLRHGPATQRGFFRAWSLRPTFPTRPAQGPSSELPLRPAHIAPPSAAPPSLPPRRRRGFIVFMPLPYAAVGCRAGARTRTASTIKKKKKGAAGGGAPSMTATLSIAKPRKGREKKGEKKATKRPLTRAADLLQTMKLWPLGGAAGLT